jgi:hypothetical protein
MYIFCSRVGNLKKFGYEPFRSKGKGIVRSNQSSLVLNDNIFIISYITGARGTELPPLFKFLFTYLFTIEFLYYFNSFSLI